MNASRIPTPPYQPAPIVYPTLGRAIIDSSITVGKTILVGGAGLGLLIACAMAIALAITSVAYVLGFDISVIGL